MLVQPPGSQEPVQVQMDPETGEPLMGEDGMPATAPIEVPLLVPVNTWDDHRIHIERHNHYRKGQAFEQLPKEAKDLFEAHVNQHIAAIVTGAMGALPPELMDQQMVDSATTPEAYQQSQQQQNPSVPEANL
jgi:hypothetical protein